MTEFDRYTAAAPSQEPTLSARKAYHAPTLHCYGTVQELTLTNSSTFSGSDGGTTFPNIYAS